MSRRDRITIPAGRNRAAPAIVKKLPPAASGVGPLILPSAVPWLVVTHDDLRRLPLDARAGFVVSLLDGRCTVEMLLDLSGLPEDETLEILRELVRLGAVELREP